MDAERVGKVINLGALIGKGVISGGGSAGGCCGRGGAPALPPTPARPPLPVPSGKLAIKNRREGGKAIKRDPAWSQNDTGSARVGGSGWGAPRGAPPPQTLLPLLGEAAPATLQAPALLNLPA